MAAVYVVTSGSAALIANTVKTAIQLATDANTQNRIVEISVTFNGTNAAATPVRVDIIKAAGASSGGAAFTPVKYNTDARVTADTTARVNDTTPGITPVEQETYFVSPTSGLVKQLPLGRELSMAPSEFLEIRLNADAAVSYKVNLMFEE